MLPGLQGPSRPVADRVTTRGHRHVRAVALEADADSIKVLRSSAFVSRGRAQWTRVAHVDVRFARRAHRDLGSRTSKDLCARKASSRPFGGGGTQGARKNIDGAVREIGAGVRDLRSVGWGIDLRDVVIKARRDSAKATDAEGARR